VSPVFVQDSTDVDHSAVLGSQPGLAVTSGSFGAVGEPWMLDGTEAF
jgi:hypothetical protein